MTSGNGSGDLYQLGPHPDGVRAICKECERVVLKNSEGEAAELVDEHNEERHGGEDVAGVCAWDVEPLLPDPDSLSPRQKLDLALAVGGSA